MRFSNQQLHKIMDAHKDEDKKFFFISSNPASTIIVVVFLYKLLV